MFDIIAIMQLIKIRHKVNKLSHQLIVPIFQAGISVLTIAFGLNLLDLELSGFRSWFEANAFMILLIMIPFTLSIWDKLMPTLRALFRISRSNVRSSGDRIKYLILTGIVLLLLASSSDVSALNWLASHSAQLGYLGDLLIVIGFLGFIAYILMPVKVDYSSSMFAADDPDTLNNLSASQSQALEYMVRILDEGVPRSLAITGDWGSGKSKLYKMAKEQVALKNPNIIWTEFNPWRYASEEALVKGFYETIAAQLEHEIPGFQNSIYKIAKSVEQLVSKSDSHGILKYLSSRLDEIEKKDSSPDVIIKELLEREGRRLVVVLDDVERQYDRERTYRSLQLVHHAKYMGSENLQIVSIYEKAALLNAAPDHVPSKEEFLEKFSEIEINVPPPDESSLRPHLESLLKNENIQANLPSDFKLNLDERSVRNIKSHRGIVRAFNQIVLEFVSVSTAQKRGTLIDAESDNRKYVDYTDRFLMSHLKLKYPLIFQDIAKNRSLYTKSKDMEEDINVHFMDDKEYLESKRKHFLDLFGLASLDSEEEAIVKGLLEDLFPVLSNIFENYQKHIDYKELRRNRNIGHPDVLDAYFAQTGSQDLYIQNRNMIEELLRDAQNDTDATLFSKFSKFMSDIKALDPDSSGLALLREELVQDTYRTYRLRLYRAWLRAAVTLQDEGDEARHNRELARVLGAINDDIIRETNSNTRINRSRYIFQNINDYLTSPYTSLLLLLFLLPERGNNFLSDYVNGPGMNNGGLFDRVLRRVDQTILQTDENLFEKDESYWAFIAYQWSLSISMNGKLNISVPYAKRRFDTANEYFRKHLKSNSKIAYTFLRANFWKDNHYDGYGSLVSGWSLDQDKIAAYDPAMLLEVVNTITASKILTTREVKELKGLTEKLVQHLEFTKL